MQHRSHRYKTEFPTKVRTAAGPQSARVTDVNNNGAQIVGPRNLQRGDKVQVEILLLRVEAIVQWAANGKVGINFRPQISDDQVDTLRYRRDGRRTRRHGTVGFGFTEMT